MSDAALLTKILILAAEPSDTARLRLGREVREIKESLRRSKNRDHFELEQSFATRPVDFSRHMLEYRPRIVHFSGHGGGEGGLAFENDQGRRHLVSNEALADLFRQFQDELDCVFLNS